MGYKTEDRVYSRDLPRPTRKHLYAHPLANVPGFSIVAILVKLPPNGATPPHRHGGASVAGVVVSGTAYNKMNDGPTMVLGQGESWYEEPGCHHVTSANASGEEECHLLATFVVETKVVEEGGPGALVVVDEEWADVEIKVE
ncbi:cupin domain protein [Diplodia corticola]|uniref:Cupin domain protein n=1 Tax=Diplodia corticola TaxID=236234 RepID=A0A1J9QPF1_9PEZI|nr:cupin domain protein [Diplodia corticola]OJD30798.1 cupin domain protein [Diplodia corticola]